MKNISKTLKITGILSIFLWVAGSVLLFNEPYGKATSFIVGLIIVAGYRSELIKKRERI